MIQSYHSMRCQNDLNQELTFETNAKIAAATNTLPPPAETAGQIKKYELSSAHHIYVRLLQTFSLSIFLITWVANSEFLQGITNGTLCPNQVPYDKPAFLTWFDYNYLILCFLVVYPYVRCHRKWTFSFYMTHIWAGKVGLKRATLVCAKISYMLLFLNILFIIGLECISVTLSNAIYQLQTAFTVALSVWLLKDPFEWIDAVGISASFVGVSLIVFPPFFYDNKENADGDNAIEQACSSESAKLVSSIATLTSAAVWAIYQVSWRVFSEMKDPIALNRLEGFIDTLMTLTMIGICNLVAGWPMLPILHWLGFEIFELPPQSHWGILNFNALVEYACDVSCALAIYMTSPVVTAIAAPLVIPLSLVADHFQYGSPIAAAGSWWGWVGGAAILAGVILIETKPNLSKFREKACEKEKRCLIEAEFGYNTVVSPNSLS